MDVVRLGRSIRALRRRRGWRQVDLARAAEVSRSIVSRVEVGRAGSVPTTRIDRLARALGARLELRLNWNGEGLDRLLDADHAALVEAVASMLRSLGWEVAAEVSFWIRGERGSVDVLAWHPGLRLVLIVECKTVIADVQATLFTLDRKQRLGLEIARERGWAPVAVGKLLVISDTRTERRRVERLAATFAAEFPARGWAVRRWLHSPSATAPLRGLLLLANAHGMRARHRVAARDGSS